MNTPTCTKSTQTERKTCGRCGGDGKYPSSCYNGVCLGCGGRGFKLTKRGQAADAYLLRLRSLPVEQLAVGMSIRADFGMAGQIRAFAPVVSFERATAENTHVSWHNAAGELCHPEGFNVTVEHPKYGRSSSTIEPGKLVRVAQTAEQKAATLAQALAYQDTLTQAGTVRKAGKATPPEA